MNIFPIHLTLSLESKYTGILLQNIYKRAHDKSNKMTECPAKTHVSLGNIGHVRFRVKFANYYGSYDPFSASFFANCLFLGEDGSWAGASV